MGDSFLPQGVSPPDFYIAAMGRSGSTMIGNWLTRPPEQLVFNEPFFLRPGNSRLLRIQLKQWSMPASEEEWKARPSETARDRFARLLQPRLAGRRWALKEVLAEEHERAIGQLRPRRLVICVRNIFDVALSFFEKHRLQNNLDRFGDDWVVAYCIRESAALVALRAQTAVAGMPVQIVRYEDFTRSEGTRDQLERFVGWRGGGDLTTGFVEFGREFEVLRHGGSISPNPRVLKERWRPESVAEDLERIAQECQEYQKAFDYEIEVNENLSNKTVQ